jgi:cytochrome b subunit of formate dehydrogenase
MKLGELFSATDARFPSILDFLITSADIFFQNSFLILLIIIGLIIVYEKFYKRKDKNTVRAIVLLLTFLLLVFYCISIPFLYIAMTARSLHHPKISETIDRMLDDKYNNNPNKKNPADAKPRR